MKDLNHIKHILNKITHTIGDHPVKDLSIENDRIVGFVANKYSPTNFEKAFWRITDCKLYYSSSLGSEWFDIDLSNFIKFIEGNSVKLDHDTGVIKAAFDNGNSAYIEWNSDNEIEEWDLETFLLGQGEIFNRV